MASLVSQRVGRRVMRRRNLRETARLLRQTDGSRDEFGEFVKGMEEAIDVEVVTAPITGRDRQVLPEGLRDRDLRTFWLQETVEAVEEGTDGHGGDRIEYDGSTWQVMLVENWGGFSQAVTVRQP